jgi:hypothetical protein
MKFRQKPNGMWVVDYVDDGGARKRVSTGIKGPPSRTPPADVKAAAREIILGIRTPKPVIASNRQARKEDGRLTMSDLFDRCEKTVWAPSEAKSQASIRSNVKILRGLIGSVPILDMNYTRLEALVEEMRGMGYAPATIKRKMDMVSKALRMATKWEDDAGRPLLASKPSMPPIRVDNTKDRVLFGAADAKLMNVPNEEALVLEAIEQRRLREPGRQWFTFGNLFRALIDHGGRLTETLNGGEQDIQFMPVLVDGEVVRRPVVVFPRYGTKSDKPRTVPLTDAAWAAYQAQRPHMAIRKVEVKVNEKADKLVFFPLSQGTAWYMFDQIKEDVKAKHGVDLSDVTLHTLRHTCLTRLARSGKMDLLRLQMWAGHSDPKITADRYAHLIPSNLMDGLLALGSSNGGLEPFPDADSVRPVIVPDMTAATKGANLGTPVIH